MAITVYFFLVFAYFVTSFPLVESVKELHLKRFFQSTKESTEVQILKLISLKSLKPLRLNILFDIENEDAVQILLHHISSDLSGLLVYQFNETRSELNNLLTSSTGITIFVLLCTPSNILETFKTVNDGRLPSHFVHWLLVMADDVLEAQFIHKLETLIFEGTRVTLIIQDIQGSFRILSAEMSNKGFIRFSHIGQRNNDTLLRDELIDLFSSDQQHLYSDMNGREIRISALEYWPYFIFGDPNPDGSYEAGVGLDVVILKTLSNQLNFTFKIVPPKDVQWGTALPDGRVTGMIGEVARREAQMALCGFAVTEQRETVIDFSFNYFFDGFSIYSRAPKQKNRTFAVISPFSIEVWMYIIISVLAIGPVLCMTSMLMPEEKMSSDDQWDLQSYTFNMFRSLVIQGNLINTPHWPYRFIFFFWFIFCLTISAMYSGMLTAVLAVPSYETPIDYLSDLPKAVRDGNTLILITGTVLQYLLEEATDGIYKEVWDLFLQQEVSERFVKNEEEGIKKVISGKYIFLAPETETRVMAGALGKNLYHFSRETFFGGGVAIPCSPGAPYRITIDHKLVILYEAGLINKWLSDELSTVPEKIVDDGQSKSRAFTLSHLQAAFFVIGLGASLAAMVLVAELLLSTKENQS